MTRASATQSRRRSCFTGSSNSFEEVRAATRSSENHSRMAFKLSICYGTEVLSAVRPCDRSTGPSPSDDEGSKHVLGLPHMRPLGAFLGRGELAKSGYAS